MNKDTLLTLEIFNEAVRVGAEIGQLQGMSAHGDTDDLSQFLTTQQAESVKGVFLVHGEYAVQKDFCERLQTKGFQRVEVPAQHDEFSLPLPRKRKRITMVKSISA